MLYWLVPLYLLIGIFIFGVTKKPPQIVCKTEPDSVYS